MNNKEAIEQLKDWSPWDDVRDVDRFNEALELAIKALEQQERCKELADVTSPTCG